MFFFSVNHQFLFSHELIPVLFTPHPELQAFPSQMHSWLLHPVTSPQAGFDKFVDYFLPLFYLDLKTPLFGPLPLVQLLLHSLLNVYCFIFPTCKQRFTSRFTSSLVWPHLATWLWRSNIFSSDCFSEHYPHISCWLSFSNLLFL